MVTRLLCALGLLICFSVQAHGTGGYVEIVHDNYRVDIDYPNPQIVAGKPNFFNVRLYDVTTGEDLPFNNVELYALRDNEQYFSANIFKAPQKVAGFTAVFPVEGRYQMFILFYNANNPTKEFLKESFELVVTVPQEEPQNILQKIPQEAWLGVIGGVLLGLLIAALYILKFY
jgi:hypothetical protein